MGYSYLSFHGYEYFHNVILGVNIMFGLFKKNKEVIEIVAPVAGDAVPSSEVADPTFATEMLGKGMAIKPVDGKVYAPVDGSISLLFDTKHAISFASESGAEILVHVGLDTVALKGQHFTAHVSDGDPVKKGDLVLEFDIDKIVEAGFDTISPIIVCNTDDYSEVTAVTGKRVEVGETILTLTKA